MIFYLYIAVTLVAICNAQEDLGAFINQSEPTTTVWISTVPALTEPTSTVPTLTEPTSTVPSLTEPTTTLSNQPEPTTVVPTSTIPTLTEPTSTVPTLTEPTTTFTNQPEPTTTVPTSTVPTMTEPTSTIPTLTEPTTTFTNQPELTTTVPTSTVPTMIKPTSTISTLTEPTTTFTNQPELTTTVPTLKVPTLNDQTSTIPTLTEQTTTVPTSNCTTSNGYYKVDASCDAYIKCENYKIRNMLCPDGLHFDPHIEWPNYPCRYPFNVRCEGRGAIRPAQPTTNCPRRYGYFSSPTTAPENCDKFLICVAGHAFHMSCPPGLAYNSATITCDWPERVPGCKSEDFLGFKCPFVPLDVNGNPAHNYTLNFKHETSCRYFLSCVTGKPRLLSCEDGLAFDSSSGRCVPKATVNCNTK